MQTTGAEATPSEQAAPRYSASYESELGALLESPLLGSELEAMLEAHPVLLIEPERKRHSPHHALVRVLQLLPQLGSVGVACIQRSPRLLPLPLGCRLGQALPVVVQTFGMMELLI